jgi:ABC-type nitrate/sulfonate/bicarbonate transport system substrate-binding protein
VSVIAREFERQRPREASKAVEVVQQGVAFMKSNPAEARALLPKFTKMPREIASRVNVADVTLSNEVDVANLQRFIDLLFESGEIPQKIDAHRLVEPTK